MTAAYLVALAIATVLTFFETANKFYFPEARDYKRRIRFAVTLFCLLNGALAALLLWIVRQLQWKQLIALAPIMQGLILGFAYLTVVRSKILSITTPKGEEVPFGPEYLYNLAKEYFYRIFNRLSNRGLGADIDALCAHKTLADLAREAKLQIDNHQLLSADEKTAKKAWLAKVLSDTASTDDEKKAAIAAYILTDKSSS
jgi:hypothetical protein